MTKAEKEAKAAEEKAAAEAKAAEKKTPLVEMRFNAECIKVHPTCVAAHEKRGWKVADV